MANVMKIQPYGGSTTTLLFSPLPGYIQPNFINRKQIRAADGTLYMYDYSAEKKLWNVPLNNMAYSASISINDWWASGKTLVFWPDMINASSTTVRVRIINETVPLQMWFETGGWRNIYAGELIISQV